MMSSLSLFFLLQEDLCSWNAFFFFFFLTRSAQWFSPLKRMVNCTFLFSSTDSDRKWNICRSSNKLCFTHCSISGYGSWKQSFSLLCMHCCFEMPFPMLPEGNRWTQMFLYFLVFQQRGIPDHWNEENRNMKVCPFFLSIKSNYSQKEQWFKEYPWLS